MTQGCRQEFKPNKTTIALTLLAPLAAHHGAALLRSIQQNQGKTLVLQALRYNDGPPCTFDL